MRIASVGKCLYFQKLTQVSKKNWREMETLQYSNSYLHFWLIHATHLPWYSTPMVTALLFVGDESSQWIESPFKTEISGTLQVDTRLIIPVDTLVALVIWIVESTNEGMPPKGMMERLWGYESRPSKEYSTMGILFNSQRNTKGIPIASQVSTTGPWHTVLAIRSGLDVRVSLGSASASETKRCSCGRTQNYERNYHSMQELYTHSTLYHIIYWSHICCCFSMLTLLFCTNPLWSFYLLLPHSLARTSHLNCGTTPFALTYTAPRKFGMQVTPRVF